MPDSKPRRLFLIDGYALIYRAFFALISRPLRTSRGENTSAAWGVVNFLLRLRDKHHPDYLAWVHDAGDSFRTEVFPEYKSTREKLDDELQVEFDRSVERIGELLAAFRVPIVSVPGYEADDVIGTLARLGVEQGYQVVIVSGDKDFYQLIRPGVTLLNPGRGGPAAVDEQWVDQSNAAERLGVPPTQVVDYLALVGDTADNVPGVKGIGPKGAAELLGEFGDLENLLRNAANVKAKRAREALQQYQADALLSRQLVTIRSDVPVVLDEEAFKEVDPDLPAVIRVCTELEFHTLVRKLGSEAAQEAAEEKSAPPTEVGGPESDQTRALPVEVVEVPIVDTVSALAGIIPKLKRAPLLALDTESTSAEPHGATVVGVSLAASPTEVWYLPFNHRAPLTLDGAEVVRNLPALADPAMAPLVELLQDPAVPKAGHDIKHDWQVLRQAGVELAGVGYDTMIASFVLDPGRRSHALDTLSLEHLGRAQRLYADVAGKGKAEIPFAEVPVTDAAGYSGAKAAAVLALEGFFAPSLREMGLTRLLREIELPLVQVLVDMEWEGIAIDRSLFARMSGELTRDLAGLEKRIEEAAGTSVNLNSPKQLAALLFEKLQLPVLKKTKTGPSTDADVLEQLAAMGHTVPTLILEYRELQKLKSTYVEVLPSRVNPTTRRIHTSFNQTGAATGRLSSSDPNLQNIPVRTPRGEEIRKGFVPSAGYRFVVADYSQIELRLMAHLSEDPAFIRAFREGGDIHRQTASIIFGVPLAEVTSEMRARAKTINFGTIYGQGPFALSRQLGISQDEAKAFIQQYFERFAGVRAYLDLQVRLAREHGFVETLFGRRRYIPEIKDKNFNLRSFAERTAQNTPLQGSAADLIKIAMVRIHQALRSEAPAARLLLQVHDELVLEAPEADVPAVTTLVRRHMEGAAELKVPLVVDIGTGINWLDAKH